MLRHVAVSILTRSTRRNIPEEEILHSHRGENLKSSLLVNFAGNDSY
jgi:hypothetical protein